MVYCKKDGDWFEAGVPPAQGKRNDLAVVRDMVKNGESDIKIADAVTSFAAISCLSKIKGIYEKGRNFKTKVYWLWGATDVGKSTYVYSTQEEVYTPLYHDGKLSWFEFYDAHEVVLLDDFRNTMCSWAWFLRLCDRFPLRVACKGSSRQFLARKLFITCPYHPRDVINDWTVEDPNQLLRRLTVIISFGPGMDAQKIPGGMCISGRNVMYRS